MTDATDTQPRAVAEAESLRRQAVSAIEDYQPDLAASLLQYQQAYQASAKMIQIAQSIFDTLIRNLAS